MRLPSRLELAAEVLELMAEEEVDEEENDDASAPI